jgi:hypothetical protein
MRCANCGRPVVFGPPTPDRYWYHPATQSVWCDLATTATRRATPDEAAGGWAGPWPDDEQEDTGAEG